MKMILVIAATVTIAGCASAPTGPSVMVLPGTGKSTEQFQQEDARCRQMASNELASIKGGNVPDQRRYDMAYMQCMYASGNQVPVSSRPGYSTPYGAAPATSGPMSAPPGTPSGTPPPPPAGTPPPPPPSR
jgi:hypothetical protein